MKAQRSIRIPAGKYKGKSFSVDPPRPPAQACGAVLFELRSEFGNNLDIRCEETLQFRRVPLVEGEFYLYCPSCKRTGRVKVSSEQ